jgi:hypothetical protein
MEIDWNFLNITSCDIKYYVDRKGNIESSVL